MIFTGIIPVVTVIIFRALRYMVNHTCLGGGCKGIWEVYSSSAILGHCLFSHSAERQGK